MKNAVLSTVLIILSAFVIQAQSFQPQIIPLPESPEQADFHFLKDELKDAQVVLLGENSHFDGNVFEMKTKLVQMLVEEMGFTTIAFESGIYDVWLAQQKIRKGESVRESLENALFPIWSKSNEFQSFSAFYEQHKNTVDLIGFDFQFSGRENYTPLVQALYDYATRIKGKIKLNRGDLELLLESITTSGMFDEEDITYAQFTSALTEFQGKIKQQPESEEKGYWQQITKSLLELGKNAYSNQEIYSEFVVSASDNIRDKQMAENVLVYLKANPKAKVICWGANVHFVNQIRSLKNPILTEFTSMGAYLKQELQQGVYSLAAVTAKDSIYLQNKWHRTPVHESSFEYFLTQQNAAHVFVSSRQAEMNVLKLNRLFSPIAFVEGNLSELHDGYFFFKEARPSTQLGFTDSTNLLYKKEQQNEFPEVTNEIPDQAILLDEVVIYSKRTPYFIMKQVIDALPKNYPTTSFRS